MAEEKTPEHIFPDGFLWGTATAAHQVEGNNMNCDWWEWEQSKDYKSPTREYPVEPSNGGCDSYTRYEEDFDLCRELNNNAVRISIEWARLEPEHGNFSEAEFDHYRKVLLAAKARGLKTFVTLHHFTNPTWFANKGGWVKWDSSSLFARYAEKCAKELGDLIDVFLTINEPQVYTYMSFMNGTWPPNKTNPLTALMVQVNMMRAHRAAYDAIKSVKKKATVGVVKNIVWYETFSAPWHIWDKVIVEVMQFIGADFFLMPVSSKLDLIGLNYYFTNRIENMRTNNPNDKVTDLGWWVNPEGLEKILIRLKRYKLPIYVTENGLADEHDLQRTEFIQTMLISCYRALKSGVDLRGYFHWSLLDNYEWHHGYWPRFGLVEIDRSNNFKRKPRKSFYEYAKISKENGL